MTFLASKHPARMETAPAELTLSKEQIEPRQSNEHSVLGSEGVAPEQLASNDEQIALLAYWYWQERGCPEGSPEEDWFRAERAMQLHKLAMQVDFETSAPAVEQAMSKSA